MIVEQDKNQLATMNQIIESSEQHCNVYCAITAQECLTLIAQHEMDLIILDIDLPDQSGLEIVQRIRKIPGYEFVWIILLSINPQYETEAFKKTHCYDYVIKPYDAEALFGTVQMLSRYKTVAVGDKEREFVTFKQRDQYIRVLTKDILYIEVIGNNSTLYTYSQIFSLRKMSLKKLKLMLPRYFVQCHKSFIVNRNYIEKINKGPFGWEIRLKDYAGTLPNGEKYKDNVTRFAETS
jgi:two-component system response regulator LytT